MNDVLARVTKRMQELGYGAKSIQAITSAVRAKKGGKKAECAEQSFKHVTADEGALMRQMHEDGQGVKKIAATLHRSTDTVSKHVFKKHVKKAPHGRPVAITPAIYKRLEQVHKKMLKELPGQEVTIAMLKKRMGLQCSEKSISRAFWRHGVHVRPLYEKPDLSPEDVRERRAWASKHVHRSPAQWQKYVHAVIDSKTFQVCHTGASRGHAARRTLRGAYREKRRVFSAGYTKPPTTLKQNSGAKSVHVTCAIGNGKVLMWHVTPNRWNGASAAAMYSGALRRALEKEYPHVHGAWRVLEDNDPSGFKSSKGMAAKDAAGIITLDLPKRSPDLNPLDFSFWAAVNKKMRRAERAWPKARRETREAYVSRLARTARSLKGEYIHRIIGAMAGRVQQVVEFNGGFFPEGGS